MDRQSGRECSIEKKSAGFSTVEQPNVAAMQLHLLPCDVLHEILSQLSLKEVVRMSILSREWRQLRICHPDLVLTQDTFFGKTVAWQTNQEPETTKFITKVENLLHPLWSTLTTTTTTLDKFVIKFCLGRKHKHHIDRWIKFSTASRAKHIAFDFTIGGTACERDKYILQLCNLSGSNGSCIKHLDLGYVCLKLPPNFCGMTNLKKLTLKMVSINRADLECLLLSCALLESLSIELCNLSSLSIRQGLYRLQDLRVRYCDLDLIELHTSNIIKFEFDESLKQIVLSECFKLSEATFVSNLRFLPFDDYCFNSNFNFTELPTAIPHAHKLFLLLNADQMLTFSETQSKFLNLRHLNMNLEIFSDPWDTSWVTGFVNLLELASLLEELELRLGHDIQYFPAPRMATAAEGPLHHHLKSVYMTGFCDVFGLAELALYILGNATALKRMVVDPVAYSDPWNDDIYSVSMAGSVSTKERQYYIDRKRMFAEHNLNTEVFRHVLTIL